MSKFTKASIVLGAVTETDSLRTTVKTIEEICNPDDVAEIIIQYPDDEILPECRAVIDKLVLSDYPIPVVGNTDKHYFLSSFIDAVDIAEGSHIILCDSDMSVDLKCIPEMIKHAKCSPEIIYTCSRFMPGCKFYGYNKIRLMLNHIAQIYLRILFHTNITDLTAPYQIAPKEMYKAINFEETGFPFLMEMILKPLRLGYKMEEFPTNSYGRKEGKSRNSFKQTAMYLKTSIHIRFMKKGDILLHPIGDE